MPYTESPPFSLTFKYTLPRGFFSASFSARSRSISDRSSSSVAMVSLDFMATDEELRSEIERLRAENEALKKPRGNVYLKVSEKGGLSVYGMGRFPITLYREQWEKLLGMADEIRNFIRENDQSLKKKE